MITDLNSFKSNGPQDGMLLRITAREMEGF